MFRVPADPANPSFDHVVSIGFGRWLTSSGADRREWARRRNAAAAAARSGQQTSVAAAVPRPAPAPVHTVTRVVVDRDQQRLRWLARVSLWLASIELGVYVLALVAFVAVTVVVLWVALP